MNIEELSINSLDFDVVQFALAISLDHLGADSAAKPVLEYAGVSETSYCSPEVADALLSERSAAKSACENSFILSRNSDGTERKVKQNVVDATIDYFWNNPVLSIKKGKFGSINLSSRVTLASLISLDVKKMLYAEVMRICFKYSETKLLIAYIQTNMFAREFRSMVINYLRKHGGTPPQSSSVFHELQTNFRNYVDKYCSGPGTYFASSANPNGYLLRDNNNGGPFSWFVKEKGGKFFFGVLNTRGSSSVIGGDDFTILDTISVENGKAKPTINFSAVCTKINTASRMLFCHVNKDVALYDILSHYRDRTLRDKQKELKQLSVAGIDFNFSYDSISSEDGSETTIRNKLTNRKQLCDTILAAYSRGLRKEDLYSEVYCELIDQTSLQAAKDGIRIFSVDGIGARVNDLSNSDRFCILMEGYNAMFELIDFIEEYDSDVTVSNFPVDILRMSALLSRFNSFDDYIKNREPVVNLCNQVRQSPARSAKIRDGLYSNDAAFSLLAQNKMLNTDPVLAALMKSDMKIIHDAVEKYNTVDEGIAIARDCGNTVDSIPKLTISEKALNEMKGVDLERLLCKWISFICKTYGSRNDWSAHAYAHVCDFARILKVTLEREGVEVVDSVGHYLLSDYSIKTLPGMPKEVADFLGYNYENQKLLRSLAVQICTTILFDFQLPSFDEDGLSDGWYTLRDFWIVTGVLSSFFTECSIVMPKYGYCDEKSLYLLQVMAAADASFLRLHHQVESASELYALSETNLTAKCFVPEDLADQNVQRFTGMRVKEAYNRMIGYLPNLCKTSNYLLTKMQDTFRSFKGRAVYDTSLEDTLAKAAESINLLATTDNSMRSVYQSIRSYYHTDEMGYVKNGSVRYVYGDNVFVHSFGYTVTVTLGGIIAPEIEKLSSAIFADMRRSIK